MFGYVPTCVYIRTMTMQFNIDSLALMKELDASTGRFSIISMIIKNLICSNIKTMNIIIISIFCDIVYAINCLFIS